MRVFVFIGAILISPTLSVAQQSPMPPLQYFEGKYKAVGLLSDKLVSDEVSITKDGKKLTMHSAQLGDGWLETNPRVREGASPLTGQLKGLQLFCLFQNDPDNYPRLTCRIEPQSEDVDAGLLTLWPVK